MSEFTFNCPRCQQHLSAESSMVGVEVDCPTCSGRLIVPESPASRPKAPSAKMKSLGACPYCRTEITATDRSRVCPTCHTPHHADCWKENKGCTVFGCAMAPPDEEKISVGLTTGMGGSSQVFGGLRPPNHVEYRTKTTAPGATSSLVWGIVGLLFCGLIFGCFAISNANKAKKLIQAQPDLYTGDGLATSGLVIGIIDIVGWGLIILAKLGS